MIPLTTQQIEKFAAAFPAAKRNELMAAHTYLKIGGPARFFLIATLSDEIVKAAQTAQELMMPFAVIGGGSNLLVSDDGYEGVVIQAAERAHRIEDVTVVASAGMFTGVLARTTVDAGLTGFEWGAGVPGTLGGAVYGNAGCFGGEMKNVVSSIEAYDVTSREKKMYVNSDCRFGYRDSRFKHEPHIILSATLSLKGGDIAEGKRKLDEIASKRKDTQPQGAFSAGCLFKNFDYQDESALEILRRHVEEIPADMLARKRLGAGWLIEQLGLKSTTVGKAQVSPVHGNFLVNLGGARAQDVLQLSSLVKMKVRDEYGIMLEDEVQLLGF